MSRCVDPQLHVSFQVRGAVHTQSEKVIQCPQRASHRVAVLGNKLIGVVRAGGKALVQQHHHRTGPKRKIGCQDPGPMGDVNPIDHHPCDALWLCADLLCNQRELAPVFTPGNRLDSERGRASRNGNANRLTGDVQRKLCVCFEGKP